MSADSDSRPDSRRQGDRKGSAKAMTLPIKDLGSKRRTGDYFECPTCGTRYRTLADFDNRRCEA